MNVPFICLQLGRLQSQLLQLELQAANVVVWLLAIQLQLAITIAKKSPKVTFVIAIKK